MKKIVRGAAITVLLSLFVAFVYAQTAKTDETLIIANESQAKLDNTVIDIASFDNNLISNAIDTETALTVQDDDKLVKKTGSSMAVGLGASRGAFSATAYCLKGRTAMGHGVRRGLIAADPRVLKLGSRVTLNAGGWSGTYLVSDTGSAIKGKKIDIWVPSCSEARKFGRRTIQVYSAQ